MRVITYKYIRKFIIRHPDSRVALKVWYHKMKRVRPVGFHDLKREFAGVDYVGNSRFVFNIKGNKYRVVALILFKPQKTYIRFIGLYSEYNKINCKEI
jgi:mRNA interferase HigB